MIKLKEIVVVEGKYDKITLSNYIDATIIATNGFSVFKDKEKRKLIKLLAEKNGAIIMTDSDSAGLQIRNFLKKICIESNVKNVYIPQILGKEKRKSTASKEGYLGVEGMDKNIILETLKKYHILSQEVEKKIKISKLDLFRVGLSGQVDSNKKREEYCLYNKLPQGMSSSAFLDCINALYDLEEFERSVKLWQQDRVKN